MLSFLNYLKILHDVSFLYVIGGGSEDVERDPGRCGGVVESGGTHVMVLSEPHDALRVFGAGLAFDLQVSVYLLPEASQIADDAHDLDVVYDLPLSADAARNFNAAAVRSKL